MAQIGMIDGVFAYAQRATGIIRNYQIVLSIIGLAQFPVSFFLLKAGMAPEVVYHVSLIAALCCAITTLFFSIRTLHFSLSNIYKSVFVPEIKVVVCSLILPLLVPHFLQEGWLRFLLTCAISIISTSTIIYYIGFTKSERSFVLVFVKRKLGLLGK
jgi:tellurite resistance protein TehA-like permease